MTWKSIDKHMRIARKKWPQRSMQNMIIRMQVIQNEMRILETEYYELGKMVEKRNDNYIKIPFTPWKIRI